MGWWRGEQVSSTRPDSASARQRAVLLGERPAVPRISDLGHLYSSSLGKLELDLMGSHQMSERQVLDAVIAEGSESGGMQGFNGASTMVLTPMVTDAVDVPVVAAGGIGDRRGYQAAFVLGAVGVQIGTAFIAAKECIAHANYKNALISASESDTRLMNVEWAQFRVVATPVAEEMVAKGGLSKDEFSAQGAKIEAAWVHGDLEAGTIPAGHTAIGPAITPDGKRLYVCNRFNNNVSVIDTDPDEVAALVDRIREAGEVSVDTETTSADPMRAVLVGISVAGAEGQAYYLPFGHTPPSVATDAEGMIEEGRHLAEAIRTISDKPVRAILYSHSHYALAGGAIVDDRNDLLVIGHPALNDTVLRSRSRKSRISRLV